MSVTKLTGRARIAGVMGWPVGHSRSPRLHGYWLSRYGVDGAYVPLAVPPEHFAEALRALPKLGFAGANITAPHKEAALAAVDEADETARRIGAVNTIIVRDGGSLSGANTDAFGFIENLRQAAPKWRAEAGPALVIGAGGAARAVIVALLDAGASALLLTNRSAARADALADEFGAALSTVPWAARHEAVAAAATLVNATSLGMTGQPPLELDLRALPAAALVSDIVYAPLQTPLLQAAAQRGNTVVDGLGMLLHQARPGFAAWFGVEPEVDQALRDHVLADIPE
jgi:shikimate dehydrogenase